MTPTALTRLHQHPDPDPPTNPCICKHLDAPAQNPTCTTHAWWKRDPIVLTLADHPNGPLAAAQAIFGAAT